MAYILVVDDYVGVRDFLEYVIKIEHEVVTAWNGLEALERIAERIPDLVISDLSMPLVDGYELAARLRAQGNQVPILFFTAVFDEGNVARLAEKTGNAGVLPFTANEADILVRVRKALIAGQAGALSIRG
jgi:CheY-like chemotaxis protein